MVAARRRARQEIEFPTEWTMVDEGVNLREEPQQEEPQQEKIKSEEGSEKVKTPLAAQAHA